MRAFKYVGPPTQLARASSAPRGTPIDSRQAVVAWLANHGKAENGWATYVVNREGTLLVAPRRSEHVACAGGEAVLAAGELRFDADGGVVEVTNNSTGYCPSEDCWAAVRSALDRAGLGRPEEFTFTATFRRCPSCGERNLVKDRWYVCAVCNADLPAEWNFAAKEE